MLPADIAFAMARPQSGLKMVFGNVPGWARIWVKIRNLELITPRPAAEPRDGPKMPRKYSISTPKVPKMPILGIFSVFSGCFLGVPEFRPGGYFFGIFRGNSGSGHLGALYQVGAFLNVEKVFFGRFLRMYASRGCGALIAKCTAGSNVVG